MNRYTQFAGALMLGTSVMTGGAWAEDKAAPMPETRGMQGMDPALHDQWAKEGQQDPYKDCTPNGKAAAQQAKHPMPQTKGMQGMDPKAHVVDCPQPAAAPAPQHVHK